MKTLERTIAQLDEQKKTLTDEAEFERVSNELSAAEDQWAELYNEVESL